MDARSCDAYADSVPRSRRSFLRSSIVWKLTLFVGVLVALNGGLLIGVAFFTTSTILRNQIHERLSTVAADRQEMLANTLHQLEERAVAVRQAGPHPPAPRSSTTWDRSRPSNSGNQAEVVLSNATIQHDGVPGGLDRG